MPKQGPCRHRGCRLLRKRGGWGDALPALAVEGIEERQQISPSILIRIKGRRARIQVRVGQASFGVYIQNRSESLDAAVMHAGGAKGKVAQDGHFELPQVTAFFGNILPAGIGAHLVRPTRCFSIEGSMNSIHHLLRRPITGHRKFCHIPCPISRPSFRCCPDFRCSAGFQTALSPQDGGATFNFGQRPISQPCGLLCCLGV